MDPTNILKELGITLDYGREIFLFSVIMARTIPIVTMAPFLAGKLAPNEVKMGLSLMLALLIWPLATSNITSEIPIVPATFLLMMLKEAFIGFCIGFVVGHIFDAMEMAGRIIDTVRGSSMSEVMVPHSKQRATTTGNMYYQLFLVIFASIGGIHIFLDTYFATYIVIPLDATLDLGAPMLPLADYVMKITGKIFLLATMLAVPIAAATLIIDIVFGILNRVAPQLNAYFMAMPVKAMGGVALVFVSLLATVSRFEDFTIGTLASVQHIISLLANMANTGA